MGAEHPSYRGCSGRRHLGWIADRAVGLLSASRGRIVRRPLVHSGTMAQEMRYFAVMETEISSSPPETGTSTDRARMPPAIRNSGDPVLELSRIS